MEKIKGDKAILLAVIVVCVLAFSLLPCSWIKDGFYGKKRSEWLDQNRKKWNKLSLYTNFLLYLILIFREHGESQEVELFYGVNGDFAYKLGLADYTIEPMMSTDREPREPCILVCQKRTLELNGGSLDAEELRKIESQLTD